MLVLAFVLDVVLFGGPHRPDARIERSLRTAIAAQAAADRQLLGTDGVVGTAVGFDATGGHVVMVYLERPTDLDLPHTFAGVPVAVEITGPFVALGEMPTTLPRAGDGEGDSEGEGDGDGDDGIDRKAVFERPVPIGVSTGHSAVTAGTIGARVTDGTRVYSLSNNHVYAASNGGRVGDDVFQPGMVDGGRDPEDALGTLHDFEPLRFCNVGCPANTIDAAIAVTTSGDLDRITPEDGYGAPRPRPVEPALGQTVQKYGRTTGWTKGRVTGIHATIDVQYRNGNARFQDQVVITGTKGAFSNPGDSGSLVVTDGVLLGDRRPVALLFAGSSTSTLANPIGPVLDRFGVWIDGAWR